MTSDRLERSMTVFCCKCRIREKETQNTVSNQFDLLKRSDMMQLKYNLLRAHSWCRCASSPCLGSFLLNDRLSYQGSCFALGNLRWQWIMITNGYHTFWLNIAHNTKQDLLENNMHRGY
jgi:hypothetical protein